MRKEYCKKLHALVAQDNEEEFKNLCQFLKEEHMDYLGYLVEKKNEGNHQVSHYPQKYQDLLEQIFEESTTLRRMFQQYNFPEIEFLYPDLKFQMEAQSLEFSHTYFGDGVLPKDHNFKLIIDIFVPQYLNPFLYPQVLNIDFITKEFYIEKMPMNYYTSPRRTQRENAEIFYNQFLVHNKRPQEEIDNFKQNFCLIKEDSDSD